MGAAAGASAAADPLTNTANDTVRTAPVAQGVRHFRGQGLWSTQSHEQIQKEPWSMCSREGDGQDTVLILRRPPITTDVLSRLAL